MLDSMNWFAALGYGVGLLYLLWVFYLAVMGLQRARDAGLITSVAAVPAYLTLAIGYVLDVLANVLIMTVLLLEFPQELLVTTRLKRHANADLRPDPRGLRDWFYNFMRPWRRGVARWKAKHLLDAYDPSGKHV